MDLYLCEENWISIPWKNWVGTQFNNEDTANQARILDMTFKRALNKVGVGNQNLGAFGGGRNNWTS